MVGRLKKKKQELCRNKKREQVGILVSEPFCSTCKSFITSSIEDSALAKEKTETEELTAKLSKLSVRNVNKRIKRRDDKIAESQAQIKEMERDRNVQDKKVHLNTNCILHMCQYIVFVRGYVGLMKRLRLQV